MKTHNTILIIGESAAGQLSTITTQLMRLGQRIAQASAKQLCLALIDNEPSTGARQGYGYGADQVLTAADPLLTPYLADTFVQAAEQIIQKLNPALVLLGHTDKGIDLAPRLAFRFKSGAAMDCVDIRMDAHEDRFLYVKPVFGGKAHGHLRMADRYPQIATIREGAFDPQPYAATQSAEPVAVKLIFDPARIRTRFVHKQKDESLALALRLSAANVVVCAGRGVKNQEGVHLVNQTADLLGGAVAASRPVVDYGWLPYSLQVGLTGKKVNPQLYIAVGVSGAIQHMAGCMKSKTIVAINSDENAPIFRMSHYGVVGDFQQVLTGLNDEVKKHKG